MNPKIRAIAIYLPQFHPIPENDAWWGTGFTEWTNVTKARPLFTGHYQPHLPADLGFYDLRLPEARHAQAELARNHGIHGFCYYHYWFNGRRILERPFTEVLNSGKPEFPFCLCWANENWTRRWDGHERDILLEQKYSARDDVEHIRSLIPAFSDERYIRVDGRPLFLVYRASRLPQPRDTADRWRREAERAGLTGLFLVRVESFDTEVGDPRDLGFDAALEFQPNFLSVKDLQIWRRHWWHRRTLGLGQRALYSQMVFSYEALVGRALARPVPTYPFIRSACPSWDNSPRRTTGGAILEGSTPQLFEAWLDGIVKKESVRGSSLTIGGAPAVFINAWNEWGEGNHLEPCQRFGTAYLEAVARCLKPASLPSGVCV